MANQTSEVRKVRYEYDSVSKRNGTVKRVRGVQEATDDELTQLRAWLVARNGEIESISPAFTQKRMDAPSAKWCENQIKMAADSVHQLRQADLYRVLDEVDHVYRDDLAAYITAHRPEFADEVTRLLDNESESDD